jgi:hypothetical protein
VVDLAVVAHLLVAHLVHVPEIDHHLPADVLMIADRHVLMVCAM